MDPEKIPQKDDSYPEKPLEADTISDSDSRKGKTGSSKKTGKKSKFKSIFTKSVSLRNLQAENSAATNPSVIGVMGKGDIDNDATKELSSSNQYKTFPRSKSSSNAFKEENVAVQIHRDPFLVDQSVPKELLYDPPAETSTKLVVRSPKIKETATIEERTPQRPQPQFDRKGERKKVVNNRGPIDRETGTSIRNVNVKTITRSTSGSRRRRLSNSIDKNSSALDVTFLKRRNAKIKEKAKTKELLLLVEELAQNCEYYKNCLRKREDRQEMESYQVRKENESLNLQIFKLGQEIEEWKDKCEKMESKSTVLFKVKCLSKENKDLLDDIEVLKSVICRLNKELSFYQDKLRTKYKNSPENIATYSTTSSGTEFDDDEMKNSQDNYKRWMQNPRKTLLPLLIAYDEVIAEKEEIIRDHEVALDRFKAKCMEVANENADLHKLINTGKERGTVSVDEWESLRSNAVLVLEENDLLHEQVGNLKRKEEKLFSTYQEKATGFKQTISQLETEVNKQRSAIADLESRCNRLAEENSKMNLSLQTKIPREKHDAMIQEFKQAFEELKSNYDCEKRNLTEKLTIAENEKDRLSRDVSKLENDNTQLRNDIQECEKHLAENSDTIQNMEASISEYVTARKEANEIIEDFVKHVQQLASEKSKLAEELDEERLVNEQMMNLRTKENELVGDLHSKIEAMERLHSEEIKKVQQKVKETEENMKLQGERHRREKAQYAELIKEKDRRVEYVEAEKKQLQQDLETVWKTTTTTIQNTIKGRNN